MTSILAPSGQFTHLCDLSGALGEMGVDVLLAFLDNGRKRSGFCLHKLKSLPKASVRFFKTKNELERICQIVTPDLIHPHSSATLSLSSEVAGNYRMPLVITLHGVYYWQSFFPAALRRAFRIIAVGPAQADCVPAFARKVVIIPNGIDLDTFCPLDPLIIHTPLRIRWFGRTKGSLSKGVVALDYAVAQLRKEGLAVDAKVIGDPGGVGIDHLDKLGWLENPVPYLQQSEIVFGHGRSVREGMACGNIGFLLGSGYGGLVDGPWLANGRPLDAFPEYHLGNPDPADISRDLKALYEDHELRKRMRATSRKLAIEFFDRSEMARRTLAVYTSI